MSGSYFFFLVGTSGSLTQTHNEAYYLHGVAYDHFSGRGVYGCLRRVLSILTNSQIFMALK